MSNNKINSRNTDNPYELISGIQLISKDNKNIKVGISATKFSYVSNNNRKKDLIMLDFDVFSKYKPKTDHDYDVIRKFKCIESFANKCKNPLEVITLFVDAYKQNKHYIKLKISTCPVYTDAMDIKYVNESLLNRGE